jgi:hypothetical protein
MTDSEDRLWKLHCKNEKCKGFFDYFGRLRSNRAVSCTHTAGSLLNTVLLILLGTTLRCHRRNRGE